MTTSRVSNKQVLEAIQEQTEGLKGIADALAKLAMCTPQAGEAQRSLPLEDMPQFQASGIYKPVSDDYLTNVLQKMQVYSNRKNDRYYAFPRKNGKLLFRSEKYLTSKGEDLSAAIYVAEPGKDGPVAITA